MEVSDLRVFEAVARHGNMSRAAQELNTVQSNVTARIRALEAELGVPLFQRHARGVSAAPAGQRMLPFAWQIAKLLADAKSAALDDGAPKGSLRLGGMETTTALRLSPLLSHFAKTYPEVDLTITTGTTARLVGEVLDGKLEAAFVSGPISHPELLQESIFQEELVLVTAPSISAPKELAGLGELRIIVFQAGCSYRQRLEAFLAGMGIVTARPLEFGSLDAIIACTSAGVGVSLLPRGIVAGAAQAGRVAIHQLPPAQALAETLLVRRHDAYVSSALTAFLETARAAA